MATATDMADLAALFIGGRAPARAAGCGGGAAASPAGMSAVTLASSA